MLHPQDWSIERALQLYNIPNWGAGYFNISSKGHLVVHPYGQPGPVIDLMDVVDDIRGRKLGRKIIVVVEKLSELPELLRLAEEMNVQPLIGLRSKLSTKGTGKWESSSGDFAKFGLTTPELIQAVKILKERGLEGAAKLFHFHVGSQLTDIRTV